MKTFTNYAEKKAKQFFNLLQGYTKGIRMTAILILLLMGVSNAWADYGFENSNNGILFSRTPVGGTKADYRVEHGRTNATQDAGTVSAFTIKEWYAKLYQNEDCIWGDGNLYYRIYLQNGSAPNFTSSNKSYFNWGNWNNSWRYPTFGRNSMNVNILSGLHSGKYKFEYYFDASGCSTMYCSNNGSNFFITFSINPPAINNFQITASNVISGSGTSDDPYIIEGGKNTTLTVSGGQASTDNNSALNVKFGSSSYSSTKTKTLTPTTTTQNIEVKAKYYNSNYTLSGTESSKTIYYKAATSQHTINFGVHSSGNGTLTAKAGSTSINSGAQVDQGSKVVFTAEPLTGYEVAGWYSNLDCTTAIAGTSTSTTYTINSLATAATVYVKFKAKQYTITYKDQNNAAFSGTHASSYPTTHTYGIETTLKSATKTGYTFGGWFTNSACTGNAVTSLGATGYTSNITLYAKWTANQYDINYRDQGDANFSGTHASGYPTKHTYGTATELKTATKTNYEFGGWFTTSTCTGSAITTLGATAYTNNITLYAKWTRVYKINYTTQGTGWTYGTKPASAEEGETVTFVVTPATGYRVDVSCSEVALTKNGNNYTFTMPGKDVNIKVEAKPEQYNVTLDNQGATTAGTTSITATYNAAMPSITAPTKTGYTFGGYYTATNGGGTQYYKADGTSAKNWDKTSATTLYAKWTANTYSVKFNANGGSGTMSNQSFTYDVEQALTANAFTRKGYTFQGWATSSTGAVIYTDKQKVKNLTANNNSTVNIYAVWEALPPVTIYLKANDDWKAASALQYVKYNDIEYKLDNLGCYAGEYFTTEIPATVTNFTFLRKNPDNTSEVWNETAKLTVPTNDKVLYDMTSTNIKYIYLKPNDDWKKDGAKFEACFNSTEYIQLEDIGNGLYRCENKGGKVQFNRVNPDNGYIKWNQTSDLTIFSDKNCFNITSWNGGEWTMLWDDTFWTTYNAPNVRIHIEKILNGTVKLGTWTSGNTANDIDVPINSEFVLSITPAAGYVLKNCRIKIGDNAEEEGINGKSYTICGPTTLSAEFEIPVNEITITGKDRVYDGSRVDYNQNNGWVSGNGIESNPYTLYIDEAARITISPLPERTGLTAYYKFGTNPEQTENVFDWETIGTTPTTLTVTAYYKDALGNKSIETQVTSPYFKMIPLPFYLMTSPNNEINIDRVADGENIIVQFRSDAAASVGLFCRKNNEETEESLISISQTTLYDYEYDVDNRIEPCVLHFIARAEDEVHGRKFIEEADIAIYRNVIIKINDPDGWVKNAYMWRDYSDAILTQWPGDPVLQNFGTWRVFSVKYPYYDRFIVNEGLQDGGKQTVDWILPDKNMCYDLINPEEYTHANDEDKHKYGLSETDCPNNLLVEDIENITITEGEQFVVIPKIYVGLGFTLSNVEAEVTFDNPRSITAMMSGTNITVLGRAIGESNITVAYTLNNERIEKRFKVTVEKNTHIAIQVKVPVNLDPDGDNMEWVNENSIYIRYWGTGISHTNLNMTYMYTDGTYKYAQARIPLDNNEEINFFFYYENYDIENENWRQTNWIQNVRTRGCYEVLKDGEYYNRGWRRDGDNCADSYQIKILMGNGKIYTSNIVNDDTQTLSFFAPGKNETGYKSGAVMLYYNNNMIATIDPATFETSNVYVATLNDALNNITNVAVYSGNFYIRTWGTDGDISNKGWNSIHDWTNSEKASRTFTEFVSREYEFYNHYWVQAMNKGSYDGKDVRACVANDYNDDLAGELLQDKNTDEHGDIKLDSEVKIINVRFGYDPRTNYFGRAVLKGSEYENYLNLHCDNAYADKNCTKKLPYKTVSNTDNKFRDISNWVYERDIYVQITNETPSVSLYIEAKSPKKDANVTNHLLGYVTNEVTGEETTTPIQRVVIGSGTDNGVYLVRVVYDFKTNRLIAAWLPQGTVDVSTEKTIDADVLFVRKENEEVPQINLSSQGKIKSLESMFFAIELHRGNTDKNQRHQEQYWFTLPFDCKVGSISGVHGYMQIWGIQRYNGKKRAENGWFNPSTTFWEWLTPDDVMHAGEGYLLVFDKKNAPWNEIEVDKTDANGNIIEGQKEIISLMRLYFPSTESGFDMQQQSDEHLTRTYQNHTCTITTANRDLQDSNWKVIGTTSYNNAGISGYTKDSDPAYKELSDAPSFRYQYEYTMSNDNKTFWYKYTPENGQTATYKSFYGYMVQFAGTINWQPIMSETVPDHIAARRYVPANERTSYTTRLELANAAGEVQDLTFVALDEKATIGFDQNKDLNKVLNRGTNIYTFVEGLPFAGNTLPMEKATVPVGVRVDAAGEYTFRMPDGTDGIAVTLVDNATGTHTNMLMSEYTVTLNAGTIENRFYLVVDPDRTATSVENIGEEAKGDKAKGVEKFLIDGKLFIRTADGIFDAKGQRL